MSSPAKLEELTTARLIEEKLKGALILDTRPAERFAERHIRGSLNITLLGHFAGWAALLIEPAQHLILVVEEAKAVREAQERLSRVGLERVIGYSIANERQWRQAGIPVGHVTTHRCATGGSIQPGDESIQLVDVRSRAEWLQGHLPGAISMPLLEMRSKSGDIDPSKTSLVYCHEGYRAATAASLLLRRNSGQIGILIDGVEGWSACGLPLEK